MSNITGIIRAIPSTVGTVQTVFNEISSVASSATVVLNTYTVPLATTATLQHIEMSGENIATYEVYLNAVKIAKTRTYFGGGLSTKLDFTTASGQGLSLAPSDSLVVKVTNFRPTSCDFESRIEVVEIS